MTQDLTKINSPWGLLDVETKAALQEAERNGKVVQRHSGFGWVSYNPNTNGWYGHMTYRIKPELKVVSRWINVYYVECGSMHNTRECADKHQNANRICVLRIDWHDGVPSFHKEEN
jgi:hypothetical protein